MINVTTNFRVSSDGSITQIGGKINERWTKYKFTSTNDNVPYTIIHRSTYDDLDIIISPDRPDRVEIGKVMLKINPSFNSDGTIRKISILDSTDIEVGSFSPAGSPKNIMIAIGVIGSSFGYGGQLLSRHVHESIVIEANENISMLALGAIATKQEIVLSEEKPDAFIVTEDQLKKNPSVLWYKSNWLATVALEVVHDGKTYYGYLNTTRDPGDPYNRTFTYIYPPEEEDFVKWFKQNGHIEYTYKYKDQSIIISANTTTHMGEGTNVLPITTGISNVRIDYNTTANDHTILSFPITIDVSSSYRQWSIFWYTHVIGYRTSTIGVNDVLMSKTQEIRQRPIAGSFVFRGSNYVPPYANVYINGAYIGRINADLSSGAFYFQLPDKYYEGRNIQFNEFPFE